MSTPIERVLDVIEWIPAEPPQSGGDTDLPFVTHFGWLAIEGCDLRVYRLSSGERIVDSDDLAKFLGVEVL